MILVTQHSPPRHEMTALTCTAFLRLFEVESLAPFFLRSKKGKSRRHSFVSFSHVRHFIPHPSHFALTFHIYISFKSSSLGRLRSLVTENERVHRSTVKFTRSHFFRLTDVGSIVSTNSIEHAHIWFAICSWHHTSSKEGIISQVPKLRLPPFNRTCLRRPYLGYYGDILAQDQGLFGYVRTFGFPSGTVHRLGLS